MRVFDIWVERWSLTTDGDPIHTASSDLLPVIHNGVAAMLKIARTDEERRGASLMTWYEGDGAVRVRAIDGPALLMDRARGTLSLTEMAGQGQDDAATQILCATARRLQAKRDRDSPSSLIPLAVWFRALRPSGDSRLARPAAIARELLDEPQGAVVLHGDIHHGNVLHDGERGWLAIDPKGLRGERAFDYANIFCNPTIEIATAQGRLARLADIVVRETGVDRTRLLKWVVAYAGLSAAWCLEDGEDPRLAFTVAEIATRELGD